jgi:hypothetical protein
LSKNFLTEPPSLFSFTANPDQVRRNDLLVEIINKVVNKGNFGSYPEDGGEPGKHPYYYDEKGRRIARVTYGDVESEPPEKPLGVTRYYYDCAWAE